MSAVESFDGLCGIIHRHSTSDQQVRCKYEFGHQGPHSWVKNEHSNKGCCVTISAFVHEVKFNF